ncbi:hypothetical protein LUZ60_009248 [Juncus effusus]|nr:hypothetical protein LUZ60_009248 [Juncus effusus]
MARDEEILKNLMPNRGLTELILDGYSGLNFPFWIMNIGYFLPNLTSLYLQNTETCEHLPPLGLLPNLSDLKVHNMPNLRRIDEAFFGGQGAFRRLEVLILDSLLELEEWPTKLPSNVEKFVFTHLHNLEVRNCPKLRFVPSFTGSENWWIEKSPHVLSSRATHESTHLTVILALEIKSCEFESGILPYIIRQMTNLHTLCMESCENLTIIPKWLGELTSLEQLQIRHCKSLNSLPLSVLDLPFIKSIQIVEGKQTSAEWCSQHDRFKIAANPNKSYSTITFHKEH